MIKELKIKLKDKEKGRRLEKWKIRKIKDLDKKKR